MKNQNRKSLTSVLAGSAIAVFLYVFCFLIIPFDKNEASWIAFGFTLLSFFAGFGIFALAFKNAETAVSKVYGFPILRVGLIYIIAQLILGVIICFIAAFADLEYWVPLLLSVILLGLAGIGVISTNATRNEIENLEAETERVTRPTKIFNLNIQAIIDMCTSEPLKKELLKLAEEIKYSDPVSSDATLNIENALLGEINALRNLVQQNAVEAALYQITRVTNLLNERNRVCKAFKK